MGGAALNGAVGGGLTPPRAEETPFSSTSTTQTRPQSPKRGEQMATLGTRKPDQKTALEFYLGVSYRFAPGWYGGVELLNENGYAGHFGFDAAHAETNAFFFGPAFHYATEKWWATLAVYEQLPWAGNPAHDPSALSHGLLVGAERLRVRFRLGVPL